MGGAGRGSGRERGTAVGGLEGIGGGVVAVVSTGEEEEAAAAAAAAMMFVQWVKDKRGGVK